MTTKASKGPGRPKLGRVGWQIRTKPGTKARLEAEASKAQCDTVGQFLEKVYGR